MKEIRYTAVAEDREANLFRRDWIDIDPASSAIEADVAVDQRKDRVIAAEPNILAGLKLCPALADNDVACHDHLASEFLNPEPFADAVPAVLNATLSFFVSHDLGFLRF